MITSPFGGQPLARLFVVRLGRVRTKDYMERMAPDPEGNARYRFSAHEDTTIKEIWGELRDGTALSMHCAGLPLLMFKYDVLMVTVTVTGGGG
jgi:hypothetical protein